MRHGRAHPTIEGIPSIPSLVSRAAGGGISTTQFAAWGASTPASSGGWRPQLASGLVESLVSYDGLVSGSLGVYTPSIASGRLVFAGAAGAPNGAVLQCTGASGRVYQVTISTSSGRKDIATDADINAAKTVTANLGLTLSVRQNAQIGARDRTAGTDWISASTQAECTNGIASPITIAGEGPIKSGEYHVHSIRGFFPSSTTLRNLKFADQKTHSSVLIEGNTNRRVKNITVQECDFEVIYDVDGVGDWSTGFSSTGYAQARFVYTSGSFIGDINIVDNRFVGGWTHTEIASEGTLLYVGNYHLSPYYDYRKAGGFVRLEGGNFYGKPLVYSVNETGITAPHPDVDQAFSYLSLTTMYDEARIVWHNNAAEVQGRFHSDRLTSYANGYRWSIAGDCVLIFSTHATTVDYPDNLWVDRLLIVPNYLTSLPVSAGYNNFKFGTSKALNGGTLGVHKLNNSVYMPASFDVRGPVAGDVVETNVENYNGQSGSYFAANLARWSDWASLPETPTYAEALTYFEPVAASDFDGKSMFGHVTPGATLQSDYTISDTLRPVPNLSSLTVTTASTAAFTVVTDIETNTSIHWAVFSSEVTDPVAIRTAISAGVAATAFGIDHRGNSAGPVTGGGTASLGAGTYWLCVAQYNGPKKVDVATLQFTV